MNAVVNAGANANLPHKLRHKINLGEKDLPPYSYVAHVMKQDTQVSPCNTWDHDDSCNSGSGSSDERDSGISINGEGAAEKFMSNARKLSHLTAAYKKQGGANVEVSTDSSQAPHRKRSKKRFNEESVLETENVHLKSELVIIILLYFLPSGVFRLNLFFGSILNIVFNSLLFFFLLGSSCYGGSMFEKFPRYKKTNWDFIWRCYT